MVGVVDKAGAVAFAVPELNETVALYTRGASAWSPDEFRISWPSAS